MKDIPLIEVADLLKVFGDYTRVRILYLLIDNEFSVNEIAQCLNMTVSAISHQLAILKSAKLIKARRSGKMIYYSLSDNHVKEIIKISIEHVSE